MKRIINVVWVVYRAIWDSSGSSVILRVFGTKAEADAFIESQQDGIWRVSEETFEELS